MPIDMTRYAVLRPLLQEGLELTPEARIVWLAAKRRSDPALAAELEAMLASEAELDQQGFLASGASPDLFGSTPSLAGSIIGAYTLESLLGQGGMGSVWLARRTDGRFEGKVAVKFMSIALLDSVGQGRFRREGSTLARLAHPNIARLIDAGVSPAGQPYLVLEYVDGTTLDKYCDEQRLSAPARIRLFGQVLAAVQHAHANLIVHRDLKPSNILVTSDGTVKLLDFGIAKLLDNEVTGRTELTQPGSGAFTPEYAAPEQIRGEAVSVGTDVYSLGVLLYQLLAGRHPTGEGCRTPSEFARALLDTDPARLSDAITRPGADPAASARSASTAGLRRLYHGDLDNIVARALKKDPAERYPTVSAFAADLVHFLRHEPVSARSDSWGYRASKFVRRNRGSVASAVVVALALIGATIITWRQSVEARRQRDEALFQAKRAEAIRSFEGLLISQIGEQPLTMRQLLDKGRGLLERRYRGDPRFTATILGQFAERYGELSDNATSLSLFARAESLALASGDQELIRDLSCSMANTLADVDQVDSARVLVTRALAHLADERNPDRRAVASCLLVESQLVGREGPVDSAAVKMRQALAQLDTARAMITLQGAVALNQLATFVEDKGDVREALRLYDSATAVMDSIGYSETFSAIGILNNSYSSYIKLGNISAGLAVTREAIHRVALANPGNDHPIVSFQYAQALFNAGLSDSAASWYQRMATAATANGMRDPARRGWIGAARAASRAGDLVLARRALDSVLSINRELKRPSRRDSLFIIASMQMARKEFPQALATYQSILQVDGYPARKSEGNRPVLVEASQAALAVGQADTALSFAKAAEAVAAVDSLASSQSAFVGEARLRQAKALAALGRTAEAKALIGEALVGLVYGAGEDHPRTVEAKEFQREFGSP